MATPVDFVTFRNPPVNEVALSIQFAEPVTDDAATLGVFWPQIRESYPGVEQQPALPPMSEEFGVTPGVHFQFLGTQLPSRYWFLSEDASRLIQVQSDRLTFNWRREPADEPYPRYRNLREEFVRVLALFEESAARSGRTLLPNWCEVTYINPVDAGRAGERPQDLGDILRRIAVSHTDLDLTPEDSAFQERFLLMRDGQPIGRLYAAANAAFRVVDSAPIYMLNLTARGMSSSPTVEGALEFLDFGREIVVKHFRDMTTDQMHDEWGME